MRLGIDAREIQNGVYTGIGHPLNNFLKYFARHGGDDTCVLFSAKALPMEYGPRIVNVVLPEGKTFFWDQILLPQAMAREGIELFYSPYYKIPLMARCCVVSAVLDIMYLKFGPYQKQLGIWKSLYYATVGRRFIHKADRIMTCSEFSKRDIVDFYKVGPEKIEVIPLSVSAQYRPEEDKEKLARMRNKFGVNGPYLLYMGNFKPHKNVSTIIRAFSIVSKDVADLKLVLAGPKEHTYPQLTALIGELNLQEKVIFTGKITDADEPYLLYNAAEVFVMPSFYEGFGLPPAEAMACGVPVVASCTTSIPEVVKDAGLLVDPGSAYKIAGAIKQFLSNKELKSQMITKGLEYVKAYDQELIASRFYAFLKEVFHEYSRR